MHDKLFPLALSSLLAAGLSAAACSTTTDEAPETATTRSVRGRLAAVEASPGITDVLALQATTRDTPRSVTTAPVQPDGTFRLTLRKGYRYILVAMSGDTALQVVKFASGPSGELTSFLAVADAPTRLTRTATVEADDDDDIDLGDVDDELQPADNPLEQVDSDDDGIDDYADPDDDNDGVDDDEDDDDDGNGVDDDDEDHDFDDDGDIDDVDDDDDDDGIDDDEDDDDDNDGIDDDEDDDHLDDGDGGEGGADDDDGAGGEGAGA